MSRAHGSAIAGPRCADGERVRAATVADYGAIMTWALWLAVPVGATTLAALWAWVRGWWARRAARPLGTEAAMRAHSEYLDALVLPHAAPRRATGTPTSDLSAPVRLPE